MTAVHNFAESLARSHEYEDAEWWGRVYRQAFGPDVAALVSTRDDGWAQRAGIDRQVILKSGRRFTVDEKVRDKDWPDVLLERWSDRDRRIPGWIQKPLAIDFLAYAYVPSQLCLLFPFPLLQRAWRLNGQRWIALAEAQENNGYWVSTAENEGWTTEGICVPRGHLFSAIQGAMEVSWAEATA